MTLPINELCDYYLKSFPVAGDNFTLLDVVKDVKVLAAEVQRLKAQAQRDLDAARSIGHPKGNSVGDVAVVVGAEMRKLNEWIIALADELKEMKDSRCET